ncbi:MAG: class III signal peptide-containing protein, partial [Candidatus Diapherotrites archaeon]|nr:class III signal peptide-containing protein [Candidatus Diapherotrites archaeon]
MFNTKGQGSLEYLLILGGAILVAVIVISAITLLPAGNPAVYNATTGTCIGSGLNKTTCEAVATPTSGIKGIASNASALANCTGMGTSGSATATVCCFNATTSKCNINVD